MKLHEIINTKSELIEWIKEHAKFLLPGKHTTDHQQSYQIDPSGELTISSRVDHVNFLGHTISSMPDEEDDNYNEYMDQAGIEHAEKLVIPDVIMAALKKLHPNVKVEFHNCLKLTVDEMPNVSSISILQSQVDSFSGIQRLTNLANINFYESYVSSNILGLLKLPKIPDPIKYHGTVTPDAEKFVRALKIVNEYYKNHDKDIIGCQSELIDEGLDEYAKL